MPEGHTIHRLARDHTTWFAGQALTIKSPQGRFVQNAERINGKTLKHVSACGKHLFYQFTKGPMLHLHLGLYGKFRVHDNPAPDPKGAVRIRIIGTERTLDLNGPNQCELIDRPAYDEILDRLGPDPLRDDADPDRAWDRITDSRAPIGQLLMDQSVIAGIGNIYRTEILWRQKIHPKHPGNELTRRQFNSIWKDAIKLMTDGEKYNKIITVDLEGIKPAKLGITERTNIYKQKHCPTCNCVIHKFELASRSVFACPQCQK